MSDVTIQSVIQNMANVYVEEQRNRYLIKLSVSWEICRTPLFQVRPQIVFVSQGHRFTGRERANPRADGQNWDWLRIG